MDNLFTLKLLVKLGIDLMKKSLPKWMGSVFLGGPIGFIASYFAEKFLVGLLKTTVLNIDFVIMTMTVDNEHEDYEKFIEETYAKTASKKHSEDEKENIRQQYLTALSKFGAVGNGLR